jgi:hypothetical protein
MLIRKVSHTLNYRRKTLQDITNSVENVLHVLIYSSITYKIEGNIQFLKEIQTGLWVYTFKQALTKTIKDKHKGNTGPSLHPQGANHTVPYLRIPHLCYAKTCY